MANSVMPTKWKDKKYSKQDIVKKLSERDKNAHLIKEYAVSYRAWDGAGFATLKIDDNRVTVNFYARKGYEAPKLSEVVRSK